MRGLEVAGRPRTRAPQGRRRAAGEVVVLSRAVDARAGRARWCRGRHLGPGPARPGTSAAPGGGELLLVDDHHPGAGVRRRGPARGSGWSSHRSASSRRSSTPSNSPAAISAPTKATRDRPHPHHVVGDDVDPAADRRRPVGPAAAPGWPARPGRPPARRPRRRGRAGPLRGSRPSRRTSGWPGGAGRRPRRAARPQVRPQDVGEQVVVAVPAAVVVERDQEQVGRAPAPPAWPAARPPVTASQAARSAGPGSGVEQEARTSSG